MYVTRSLSYYIKFPETLSQPPEGPNSGYLVLQDEESETTTCFGMCKNPYLANLPFPQNKELTISYSIGYQEHKRTYQDAVFLIPVLNQPLGSNRYYAIKPHRSHKGEAYTCSTEEDKVICYFRRCVKDVKPRPLDPQDIYQQFEINLYIKACRSGSFHGKSITPDGFPPTFLRRKGWEISPKTPKDYKLGEALGVNTVLRAHLPDFNFPLSFKNSKATTVGKWYCPFMFIKEGALRDHMKRSMFYEMTLEQTWEQIFACENNYNEGNNVFVDAPVKKEVIFLDQREAVWDERNVVDGAIWFTTHGSVGGQVSVGLSLAIVGRIKWEQERVGWSGWEERQVNVKRTEEFRGIGGWSKFGCYMLLERFVLKRMDGSSVMTYEFKHTHQIRSKWESDYVPLP